MTLPASGAISLYQVAVELGVTNVGINLNQTNVRTLFGKPSGAISMSDGWGKSAAGVSTSWYSTGLYRYRFGASCTATVVFNSNGTLSISGTGTVGTDTITGKSWYLPTTTGIGSSYSISINSGAWQSLTSGIQNSLVRSTLGYSSQNWNYRIALTSNTANVLLSGSILLEAEYM